MQLLLLAAQSTGSSQLVEAFKHNPTFMVLNLMTSAVVLTIVVERFAFQMTRYRVNSKEFFAQVKKLVTAGNIDRAIKLCEASDFPILQLVKSGLTHANKGPDEIDAALSEKLSELKPQAEKRVGALWSLANIATLIGLLGTVSRSDRDVRGHRRLPGSRSRTSSACCPTASPKPCTTPPSASASRCSA